MLTYKFAVRLWTAFFLLAFSVSLCTGQSRASSAGAKNTFLIATDLHFNPMADPSLVAQLEKADPAEWETILESSKSVAFSQYGQDPNWWLLRSSLDAMKKTLPHPAFVVVAGDSLAHQFPQTYQNITHDTDREHYRKFVLSTMKFLGLELRKRFADTPIYLTVGNNDEDCGNYSIAPDGTFLHDTADLVRGLAKGDDGLLRSWESLGAFSAAIPGLKSVRFISINTIFFSKNYREASFEHGCAAVSSDAPQQMLTWLDSQLSQAKQSHEKVWLMFHIPPGIDSYSSIHRYQVALKQHPADASNAQLCSSAVLPMWVPSWTEQFDALLERYHGTVVAGLAGHTHNDDFRVLDPSQPDSPYILINPAVSPIYNQNPAFRTVTFGQDGSLVDSSVYYLTNITYASSTTPGEWQREYTFSQEWKLPKIDTASLSQLYTRIKTDESVRDEWLRFYNVSSAAAYMTIGSGPGLYCAIEGLDAASYSACYCTAPLGKAANGDVH